VYNQKDPYSEEEITAILDHALEKDGGTHGYAKQPKTFRLLLELMLATGLRIGDAVGVDPLALIRGDSLRIYTYQPQKQKRAEKPNLEAYTTADRRKRIDECTWLSAKRPFWHGAGTDPTPLAQAVYERM
jgi:integrase